MKRKWLRISYALAFLLSASVATVQAENGELQTADATVRMSDESTLHVEQQQLVVTGTVQDVDGMGIPGVNVIVKGGSTGVVTDMDGKFSLSVSMGDVLEFRYVGYLSEEVKVTGRKPLNITLREDSKLLDAIVVVGYTTQKKADLTGAVSSVKVEGLNDLAVTGINNALQGRMSGVTVLPSSGAPGATTSVRIRGMGTFGNNEPLYVIDGMATENMNDINPSDIERIDVLKDAASAAIYGSRAANGVVIIQTKKGKNGKPSVTFNTYHGVAAPQKMLKLLTARQQIGRAHV